MRTVLVCLLALCLVAPPAEAVCGDCNADSSVNILDALVAAQDAAGLIMVPPAQFFDCDVDSSGAVEILDALLIAQDAAGIPVTLTCIVPNTPPTLTLDYFPASDAGVVPFYYTVVDLESDVVNVFFEFSLDGGMTWGPMTTQAGITLATTTAALAATPTGLENYFFWDSWIDAPTTTSSVMIRAWAEDAVAGPLASDSVSLTNGAVTNGYTTECLMASHRHADMAPVSIYVMLRSFSASAQLLQFGGSCQESHEVDRPAYDSTPLICTLSITFVNLLGSGTHEWPVHTHTVGDYYMVPGPHEILTVSRQLGGYIDSTRIDITVY